MNASSDSSPTEAPVGADTAPGTPRARRIQKLSRLFQGVCRVLIGLLALAAISVSVPQVQKLLGGGRDLTLRAFLPTTLFLHAYWIVALWLLERLFHSFARHGVFAPRGAHFLRWLGFMFLGSGALQFLQILLVLGLSISRSEELSILLASLPSVLGSLLLGATILMFGWVMEEGCELREQQSYTI
ncbi:MAG: DUF2975 domain-containing protein [Verrucomicrobiae bacterium]|nr:DUF2975 domain-containing protein [Verrucomicrobiae bacterium]